MPDDKQQQGGGVLRVTAPLVQVRVGNKVIHLNQGDVVPGNASQESLDWLRSLEYVAEDEAPEQGDDSEDEAPKPEPRKRTQK